jgi:hypothetical protein
VQGRVTVTELSGAPVRHRSRLASAVSEFEQSHPRMVEVVNRMATMLAGSGI